MKFEVGDKVLVTPYWGDGESFEGEVLEIEDSIMNPVEEMGDEDIIYTVGFTGRIGRGFSVEVNYEDYHIEPSN